VEFTGETVTLFELGEQEKYQDNFSDALGELREFVKSRGAKVAGARRTDGQDFIAARAELAAPVRRPGAEAGQSENAAGSQTGTLTAVDCEGVWAEALKETSAIGYSDSSAEKRPVREHLSIPAVQMAGRNGRRAEDSAKTRHSPCDQKTPPKRGSVRSTDI